MQKKLIALAVAGLLSAPAFAQSNVTLYGTLDYGFVSMSNSAWDEHRYGVEFDEDGEITNPGVSAGKFKRRSGLDSGVSKFNRIGFRGTEDLGNGLKLVFVLENGLAGDRTGGAGIFNGVNRQSYAGLAGGFGTVVFGRHYTPQHLFSAAVDPFGKNGMGGLNNSLIQDTRLDNLIAYVSPSWGGFSFIAGYTFNGTTASFDSANEAVENDGDVRVWAIAPSFTWNNLFVAANYHSAKLNSAHGSNVKVLNVIEGYASYDFGFVKLGGLVGRRTISKELLGTNKDGKIAQYMLGATFNITPNDKIMTSYTFAKENSIGNSERTRLSQWAIGYEHALSKRTALYAIGAFQGWNTNNNADPYFWAANTGANSGTAGAGGVGANALGYDNAPEAFPSNALYRRGFGVGIRHDF